MWNPDFSSLLKPKVWLEASGQIFFTLSVGIGAILTYASYIRKDQDVALSSLSSCAANGFAEVIIGGTIVIPLAIVLFGTNNVEQVAKAGTFGLGFNTMPVLFGKMPAGSLLQFIWFMLLFFAGITSSISIIQPAVSFLEDEIGWKHGKSVLTVAGFSLVVCLVAVFGLSAGSIDELDFWGGTFSLVVFGTIESILFAWMITDGWGFITLKGINPSETVTFLSITIRKIFFISSFRLFLLALLIAINVIIFLVWRKRSRTSVAK
jgi:SNF family Na+-dependent transporter